MRILTRTTICWVIVVCLFALTACNCSTCHTVQVKKISYNIFECDYSDSIIDANHQIEYTYWSGENYIEDDVKQTITINMNDVQITGAYKYSLNQMPDNYSTRNYISMDGLSFGVDDDGMLVFCFWGSKKKENQSINICTEQQCIAIAEDFVSQYVDISSYQVGVVHEEEDEVYQITFTKYLDGLKTTDCATVSILENGEIYSYSSSMFGKIPENFAMHFDYNIAKETVYQKLDTIYSSIEKNYDLISYGDPCFEYTILEDGNFALFCVVDVDFVEESGDLCVEQSEKVVFVLEES